MESQSESMTEEIETKSIAEAMFYFHRLVKQPAKTASNPFFKSKYVPLEEVVKAIDITCDKLGISYIQAPIYDSEQGYGLETTIIHKNGETKTFSPFYVDMKMADPQKVGSLITYLRRYTLSSIFGICSETDDDGNAASNKHVEKAPWE